MCTLSMPDQGPPDMFNTTTRPPHRRDSAATAMDSARSQYVPAGEYGASDALWCILTGSMSYSGAHTFTAALRHLAVAITVLSCSDGRSRIVACPALQHFVHLSLHVDICVRPPLLRFNAPPSAMCQHRALPRTRVK